MKQYRIQILVLAMVVLTCAVSTSAGGFFLGVKKASEFVSFPLHDPLDSAGIPGRPDSVHLLTYADNGSAAAFTARSTTYPFSEISLDTTKIYGDTTYWFDDQIQDIDGTAGNFLLSGVIRLWYKKLATETFFSVQVINDSLNRTLDAVYAVRDSSNAILDSLQDGSGGITVQLSTAALASVGSRAADSTWGKPFTASFPAGSMGDTLNNYSPLRAIAKTIFDSAATVIAISKASADSTWGKAFGSAFSAGSMGDSLNNASYVTGSGGGGGGAVSNADAGKIADSVWNKSWSASFQNGSMGDSLNNFTPLRASSKSIFDSSASVVTISRASADSVWSKSFGTS